MISTLKCDTSELSLKCDSSFLQNKTLRNKAHNHTIFNKVKFTFSSKSNNFQEVIFTTNGYNSWNYFFFVFGVFFSQNCNFSKNQGRVWNWMFFIFFQSSIFKESKPHGWPPMKFLQRERIIETTLATTKNTYVGKG